jgi:hypothetical protein
MLENRLMKRLSCISFCFVLIVSILTSCQEPTDSKIHTDGAIQSSKQFPGFVTGTWKGNDWGWEIVLAPDGTVISAVIALGQVRIKPNQTTEVQGRKGEPGIFEAGDCEVEYDIESREMSVSIEMKRVYMDMGSIVDGTCRYFLVGGFSEDRKIWYTEIFTELDLAVLTPDPNSPKDKPVLKETGAFRQGLSEEPPQDVIFTKVEGSGDKR